MNKYINICGICPNNFGHKAGDGTKSRRHNLNNIHPALQANCGGTQMTYILQINIMEIEKWNLIINN